MFKLHNDNLFFQVFGCVCLIGVRGVICLILFICLFIYLFKEYLSGFFYHCVSIVISFNFISLVIHLIVCSFRSTD